MYLIPTLNTQEEILTILNKIKFSNKSGTEGKLLL